MTGASTVNSGALSRSLTGLLSGPMTRVALATVHSCSAPSGVRIVTRLFSTSIVTIFPRRISCWAIAVAAISTVTRQATAGDRFMNRLLSPSGSIAESGPVPVLQQAATALIFVRILPIPAASANCDSGRTLNANLLLSMTDFLTTPVPRPLLQLQERLVSLSARGSLATPADSADLRVQVVEEFLVMKQRPP